MYDGRLEVGIGAGSMPSEHSRFLGPRPMPIEERRERVEETLQIFDDLWGYGQFSFSGTHYSIDKLNGTPEPLLTITDLGRDVLTGKVDLLSLAPRTAGSAVVLGAFEQLKPFRIGTRGLRSSCASAARNSSLRRSASRSCRLLARKASCT